MEWNSSAAMWRLLSNMADGMHGAHIWLHTRTHRYLVQKYMLEFLSAFVKGYRFIVHHQLDAQNVGQFDPNDCNTRCNADG